MSVSRTVRVCHWTLYCEIHECFLVVVAGRLIFVVSKRVYFRRWSDQIASRQIIMLEFRKRKKEKKKNRKFGPVDGVGWYTVRFLFTRTRKRLLKFAQYDTKSKYALIVVIAITHYIMCDPMSIYNGTRHPFDTHHK